MGLVGGTRNRCRGCPRRLFRDRFQDYLLRVMQDPDQARAVFPDILADPSITLSANSKRA
jgi:hypothetical protein